MTVVARAKISVEVARQEDDPRYYARHIIVNVHDRGIDLGA
jgi:hypothetical protein